MAGLFKKERFYINIQLKAWLRNTAANNIVKKSFVFDRRVIFSFFDLEKTYCVIEGFHKSVSKNKELIATQFLIIFIIFFFHNNIQQHENITILRKCLILKVTLNHEVGKKLGRSLEERQLVLSIGILLSVRVPKGMGHLLDAGGSEGGSKQQVSKLVYFSYFHLHFKMAICQLCFYKPIFLPSRKLVLPFYCSVSLYSISSPVWLCPSSREEKGTVSTSGRKEQV